MEQINCPTDVLKKSYAQFKKDCEKWLSYIQKELNVSGFKVESTEIFDTNGYKLKYDQEIKIFMIDYYVRCSKDGKKMGVHFALMSGKEEHRADEFIEEPYTQRGVPPLSRQQKKFYICPTNKVEKIASKMFERDRYSKAVDIRKWKSVVEDVVIAFHSSSKVGSDTLRSKVIRLAHTKPELRKHLIPLLKEARQKPMISWVMEWYQPTGYGDELVGREQILLKDYISSLWLPDIERDLKASAREAKSYGFDGILVPRVSLSNLKKKHLDLNFSFSTGDETFGNVAIKLSFMTPSEKERVINILKSL